MDDLISRRAVVETVTNHCIEVLAGQMYDSILADVYEMAHRHIIDVIRVLPSVQPDSKTGEWLHDLLQDAIDAGIITETQAVRIMERVNK